MGKIIEAAISSQPWCVGATLFDLDDVLDDEGRPVNERRAPSRVKDGVVIELKSCPYHDERHGKPMNVSALAQVTRHLNAVIEELNRFRSAQVSSELAWQPVLMSVLDQLARPALHLLGVRDAHARVPAEAAVGHKLAAGFFGVVNGLLSNEIEGNPWPVSVESLLRFAHHHQLLIGASEVCAGPPPLIERASEVLVAERGGVQPQVSPERAQLAHLVSHQIALGTAWESHDVFVERKLLEEFSEQQGFAPRNPFLAKEMRRRRETLAQDTGIQRGVRVPRLPDAGAYSELRSTLASDSAAPALTRVAVDLLATSHSALAVPAERRVEFAERFARYIRVYGSFVARQWELEQRVRETLGYDPTVPMKSGALVLPRPMALRWFEAGLGHRLERDLPPNLRMRLASPERKVELTVMEEKVRACGT